METIINLEDATFLTNLKVSVSTDEGSSLQRLDLKEMNQTSEVDGHGAFIKKTSMYTDKDNSILVYLHLIDYGSTVVCFVEASLAAKEVFWRQLSFNSRHSIVISVPQPQKTDKILGFYHFNDWWTRPSFTSRMSDLPERTQSILWQSGSRYAYCLPVVTLTEKTEIRGSNDGFDLCLSTNVGGRDDISAPLFVLSYGENPYHLIQETMKFTLDLIGNPTSLREHKRYPNTLEYLGWCSWDAFRDEVNATGIIEKIKELNEKQIPVRWVMIDDGWLDVKEKGLMSFDADQTKFPDGLTPLIEELKSNFGVRWVGVWHTFFGYWAGIHPDSPIIQEHGEFVYKTAKGRFIPYPRADKGFGFWNAFHRSLRHSGVDFVKVDSQGSINSFLLHHIPDGHSAYEMHTALEASTGLHFDQQLINCMGMESENIWFRPSSALSRNSDDFVPGKEISFKEHALQNAYNSLYHHVLYWGDWDMFWTNHEEATQNGVLRAVSGGPVYFSDKPGTTEPKDLLPLVFHDGKVLRADQPGLPTSDILMVNPQQDGVPLKVWTPVGDSIAVGVFNIDQEDRILSGSISPSQIPVLCNEDQEFYLYEHFSRKLLKCSYRQSIPFTLKEDEVALYLIIPILNHRFTPIGLLNKYLSSAAVTILFTDENSALLQLREGGTLGFGASQEPALITVNGAPTPFRRDGDLFVTDTIQSSEPVIINVVFA
ncbi:Sip1-related alpha-galactosidase [Paenibacillus sp. FSL H8-0259]|uniref:Sip1-related alpha-galactosidase n=1 Tax=Paenibacillus sp. FSL H8-0259 TaxID=1920423 RepID=UPI00096FC462|nr:Sip1-related alpha-galactosidase [Paenibacillus sp. FSL H8-0259]OMF28184.1 hypothetical protein BK132_13995 [Paenibacillus sp. FSL H8-0259]